MKKQKKKKNRFQGKVGKLNVSEIIRYRFFFYQLLEKTILYSVPS